MPRPPRLPIALEGPITVAALMAAMLPSRIAGAGRALAARGADPAELREAAYTASLFCGFPAAVAALGELAVLGGGSRRDRPAAERRSALARGESLFRRIHRERADRQLVMLRALHADFAGTVLAEAYGRVLRRSFLPLATRELIGVTVLAVLGLEPQLRAHLHAASNCGASPAELRAVLALAQRLTGRDLEPARRLLASLRAGSPRARRGQSARP